MSDIKVRLYQPSQKEIWDTFVGKAKNSTFLFYRDFMDYHSDRFKDFSLMVFKGDNLFALLPANRIDNELFSHQGLSYGGFVLSNGARFQDVVDAFSMLLKYVLHEGITNLYLKSLPLVYHKNLNEEIDYILTSLEAEVIKNESYYVIENLLEYRPNRNRRRAMALAQKQNIIVRKDGDLSYFWDHILSENLVNKFSVKPVHDLEEISLLKSRFPNQIQFFSAYNKNTIHAGVLMFISDQVAHFQYSSGDDLRDENGALDLLFDTVIKEFSGKKYISFGSSSTDKTCLIDKGLAYWKESFGAKLIPQKTYKINVNNYLSLESIFK